MPYEADDVTRIILDDLNKEIYTRWKNATIADLREWVLDTPAPGRNCWNWGVA